MSVLNWLEILEEKICNEVILIKVTLLTIQNLHTFKKNHLQTAQNACIRFCLRMERKKSNGLNHFEKINWLPVTNSADPCIVTTICISKNNFSPAYMSDVVVRTRTSVDSFPEPIHQEKLFRKSISYLESKIWNDLDRNIRTSASAKSFKHTFKKSS